MSECKYFINGECESPYGLIRECSYPINGKCRVYELMQLSERLNELIPNLNCGITDGAIAFQVSIVNNNNSDAPEIFERTMTVYLWPENKESPAEICADISSVDDEPFNDGCGYVQKWTINPEYPLN